MEIIFILENYNREGLMKRLAEILPCVDEQTSVKLLDRGGEGFWIFKGPEAIDLLRLALEAAEFLHRG